MQIPLAAWPPPRPSPIFERSRSLSGGHGHHLTYFSHAAMIGDGG